MPKIYTNLAISSGAAILLAMVSVGLLFRHYVIRDVVAVAEDRNVHIAQALANTVRVDLEHYLSAAKSAPSNELAARPEIGNMDKWLATLTKGLAILRIKIFTPDGRTVYSSTHEQIGEDKQREPYFPVVASQGQALSKFSTRDSFSAFSGAVFDRDIIETYTPIRADDGGIIGVFEIYTDVTDVTETIDRTVGAILAGVLVVFLILYGGLVFVIMRRAIAPLRIASAQAAAIGPRSSVVRLPTDGMPGEVLPLVQAVNGALDRLDTALDSQRRFTADAAHELLTPLAVLQANLDTMADRNCAAQLRADVSGMSNIVNQLLELAGMDALDPDETEPVDVRQVCAEVISTLAPVAYRQDKALSLTGEERPPKVRCCSKALARAVRNLVDNAIAHTPAGTTVEVNIGADAAIAVTDAGPGVPLDDRERVFERFWRGERGKRPGAGIGLSIVKSFAETYGGTVDIADAPGGGAVFTLRLPHASD